MNCVVTNDKLYIRLNSEGSPVTCSKSNAQVFEKDKAENIQKNLPKVLKNFHFRVKPISKSDQEVIQNKTDSDSVQTEQKKYSVANLWKRLREEEQYYIKNWQILIVNCQTVCIR